MTAPVAGPLRLVLDAFGSGASTLDEVGRTTSLDRELVEAAVGHLVRIGRLSAKELTVGCPDAGCGRCASGRDGVPGCGATAPSATRSGPVLVALSLRGISE